MNKNILGVIVSTVIIVVLALGCYYFVLKKSSTVEDNNNLESNQNVNVDTEKNILNSKKENETQVKTGTGKKVLIAYFSRPDENYGVGVVEMGNTEIMAGFIKDYFGDNADTFKIDPVNPYPKNYKECTELATEEKNSNARPEFKNAKDLKLDDYDTIFIGYPIWWRDVPMIINTFIEKYDFSGKTIIPFCTHEGSGQSGTFSSLKNKMSSSSVNTNGLAIRGTEARKEESRSKVEKWVKELGF